MPIEVLSTKQGSIATAQPTKQSQMELCQE